MTSTRTSALILLDQMTRNLYSSDEGDDAATTLVDDIGGCYRDDGTLDMDRLEKFLERENDEDTAKQEYLFTLMCLCATAQMETTSLLDQAVMETPRATKSRKRTPKYFMYPSTGVLRRLTPTRSLWWVLYVQNPQPNCTRWSKSFRNRFRMPYESYQAILSMLVNKDDEGLFCRWKRAHQQRNRQPHTHAVPRVKVSPIELLLLGSLRYLGRGVTFDDVEEATFISRHVHRDFFYRLWRLVQTSYMQSM